jgi:hypothetical protein
VFQQILALTLFATLPLVWLVVAGRTDLIDLVYEGRYVDAFVSMPFTPIERMLRASGSCAFIGGSCYLWVEWSLLCIPCTGRIDRIFAWLLVILGGSILVIL